MTRENDLEGPQDMGGKHGGQKGVPKPEPRPPYTSEKDGDVLKKAPAEVTDLSVSHTTGRLSFGRPSSMSRLSLMRVHQIVRRPRHPLGEGYIHVAGETVQGF